MTFQNFLSGTPARDYIFQKKEYKEQIKQATNKIKEADAILIGAGSGLSTAAGLSYSGKRFEENFNDYIKKYGGPFMHNMYSAGFYPFPTEEARWGYWARHAYFNRIQPEGLPVYRNLYELVKDKNNFILTTNVDHQFQKSGFAEKNIFATQGDYGLIQCEKGCHKKTYDAVNLFLQMMRETKDCVIPTHMVPKCPICGGPMTMNLRCDQFFVEDEKWHEAEKRFSDFLDQNIAKKMVLLELGVGFNTPTIIKFPFEKLIREHNNISLVRLNMDEAVVPESFGERAIGINTDIAKAFIDMKEGV